MIKTIIRAVTIAAVGVSGIIIWARLKKKLEGSEWQNARVADKRLRDLSLQYSPTFVAGYPILVMIFIAMFIAHQVYSEKETNRLSKGHFAVMGVIVVSLLFELAIIYHCIQRLATQTDGPKGPKTFVGVIPASKTHTRYLRNAMFILCGMFLIEFILTLRHKQIPFSIAYGIGLVVTSLSVYYAHWLQTDSSRRLTLSSKLTASLNPVDLSARVDPAKLEEIASMPLDDRSNFGCVTYIVRKVREAKDAWNADVIG